MCRRVAAAIDSEIGTLTVDRKDALLHGQFADINIARIVVDKDTVDVVKNLWLLSTDAMCSATTKNIAMRLMLSASLGQT